MTQLYQKNKTSKKFYGKYTHKICLMTPSARVLQGRLKRIIDPFAYISHLTTSERRTWKTKDLEDVAIFLHPILQAHDTRVRVEGRHFNIFLKDQEPYEKICKEIEKLIYQVWEPAGEEDLKFFEENSNKKILVDVLPFKKYKYKIHLNWRLPVEKRISFYNWLTKQPEGTIRISGDSNNWMMGKKNYVFAPFFYVTESSTITMASLFLGDSIRSIEEYVLRATLVEA